jgi:hypothetical protein
MYVYMKIEQNIYIYGNYCLWSRVFFIQRLALASTGLDPIAAGLQLMKQGVAMISLDFNYTVFARPSATAPFFECSGKFLERGIGKGNAGNNNNRAASASLDFAAQSHVTVGWGLCGFGRHGYFPLRSYPSGFAGIDQGCVVIVLHEVLFCIECPDNRQASIRQFKGVNDMFY